MQIQLGRDYQIIKEIGEGNFGKVYLGKHMKSNEKVAIKILDKAKFEESDDIKRVHIELKILMTINHPNIVQLLDFKFSQDYIFFIMEFVEGGELFKLIQQNKLSIKKCFHFFYQIFSAVEYLHSINITHRDLKPENLMLNVDYTQIKLVDFGLSRFYQKHLGCETACGSPCYAPPEMIFNNCYNAEKAEVWSLGMVLYAMIVGKLPVYDDDTQKIYEFLIQKQIEYPKNLDQDLKEFLKILLEIDQKKRASFIQLKNDKWFLKWESIMLFEDMNQQNQSLQSKNQTKLDDNLILNLSLAYCINFKRLKSYIKNRNLSHGIYCHYWLLKNQSKYIQQQNLEQDITINIENIFFTQDQQQLLMNLINFIQENYQDYTVIQSIEDNNIQLYKKKEMIGQFIIIQHKDIQNSTEIKIEGKSIKILKNLIKEFKEYNQIICSLNLFLNIKKKWINYLKKEIYIKKN